MKLHEIQTTDPAACADPNWELIPWLVNQTLPEAQADALREHAKACARCKAEIGRQQILAKEVTTAGPFDAPLAQSWQHLRGQIETDARARKPQQQGLRAIWGGHKGVIAGVGSVALACLVLVIGLDTAREEGFQTLTSDAATNAPTLKFQPASGISKPDLVALLQAQGATLASGPSAQGIYTATLAEGMDMRAAADLLMAAPQILFAAPETD